MTPLIFGNSSSPLFGVLHHPAPGLARSEGVLIAPPIGQEHIRTHWALRQVSTALARAGFPVFRFDWFGVGDSSGMLWEASLDRWEEDLACAAQELRDTLGLQKINVLALRLGALPALRAARAAGIKKLVLWDPVTDGRPYLRELRQVHAGVLADKLRYFDPWPQALQGVAQRLLPGLSIRRVPLAQEVADGELIGFQFGESLLQQIEGGNLDGLESLGGFDFTLIDSGGVPPGLSALLEARGAKVSTLATELRGRWRDASQIEELLLPADAIRAVVGAMSGEGLR